MILTLTLSPTVDKSSTVDRLMPEHKLKCAAPKFEPGGGGINVSRALKRLGAESTCIFPAGGPSGNLLMKLLDDEGVGHHSIATKSWTRENFIVTETSTNQQFRFGMPAPELFPDEEGEILATIEKISGLKYIVASGSMPPGIGEDFLAKIARLAKQNGARFIADTSGESLKHAVGEGVYLLKPNLGELSYLAGVEALDNDLADDAAKEMISNGKCEVVVVSMGAQGAYLVTKDVSEYVAAPTVKKLSTVGAGDSMVAGMVYALSQGWPLKDVVKMGVACGSATTMNAGTALFKKEDVDRLYGWMINL
jgi:6-phosphofructokinase 2